MRSSLALALVLVGCGGGSASDPLVVHAADTKLAAVHDGTAWKPLALNAAGDVTISLDGPTTIATVCESTEFFNYYAIAVGPGIEVLDMYCAKPAATATVQVTASPTTTVAIGFQRRATGQSFVIAHGTYDIIAFDTSLTPARIEVRRGITITADTTLTFDVLTAGTPMTKARVQVTGAAAGELPTTGATLTTSTTRASWLGIDGEVWLAPASIRQPGDRHFVRASTDKDSGDSRTAARDVDGTEATIPLALPTYVTSATAMFGNESTLAWQGDPRFDSFYFGINSPSFDRLWDISVMPEWTAAGGTTNPIALPDPSSIPGWQSAWTLTDPTDHEWLFFASKDDGADHLSASRFGNF